MMHPRAHSVVLKHCEAFGVDPAAILQSNGMRRTAKLQPVLRSIIVELWDPGSFGFRGGCAFRWSLSEVARQLGMDHTSVRYHLVMSGTYPSRPKGGNNG